MSVAMRAGWLTVFVLGLCLLGTGGPVAGQASLDTGLSVSVVRGSEPVEGIVGDLFLANADGSRGLWLGDDQTGPDGSFQQQVEEGCYVLVLIAPVDESFERIGDRPIEGTSRFAETSFCFTAGSLVEIQAELANPLAAAIVGLVTNEAGDPVPGIFADVFADVGQGQRGNWLGSATTDDTGRYRHPVAVGCYVVVLVASADATFTSSGTRFLEISGCAGPGTDLEVNGTVAGETPQQATISGSVLGANDVGVPDVFVDYFEASADGSRGPWLGNVTTDDAGRYSRAVDSGCFIAVVIAPQGATFAPDGTVFRELPVCVTAGENSQLPTTRFTDSCPAPGIVNLDANSNGSVSASSIVTGSDGKIYFVGDDNTAVTDIWVYDPATGQGQNLGVPANASSLIAGDGALYFRDLDGVSPPEIRSYDLATGEVTTIAQLASRFFSGPILVGDKLLWQRNAGVMVYDTETGEIIERGEGGFQLQSGIAEGPDGRIYFRTGTGFDPSGVIGWIDLETGETDFLDLANGSGYEPQELTFGPADRLYFSGRVPIGDGGALDTPTLTSVDPATGDVDHFIDFKQPNSLIAADDGRLYFRASRNGNEFLHGVDLNAGVFGQPISAEPGVEAFGTGADGRLYFAAVGDPNLDTRLRARVINQRLDTQTTVFDGATFVDELHFGPEGTIYFGGFDGTETELLALRTVCSE